MSDIVCVTNRLLCREPFLNRINAVAKAKPRAIILREKDLPPDEYKRLAAQVAEICDKNAVPLILHFHYDAAIELEQKSIHLPLFILRNMSASKKACFNSIGVSCHSVEEAKEAEALGAAYITAGHVFATDCKKGLAPRGLDFLRSVCNSVTVPVFAIGGISSANFPSVIASGAAGVCIMSALMTCGDPAEYLKGFENGDEV